MIDAIAREIFLAEIPAATEKVETIYFGGGTPGLLPVAESELILSAVRRKFSVDDEAEITLEANPEDISPERLHEWRKLGINRLSVGVQSFNDTELKWMNRAHTGEDSLRCIRQIKDSGFTNYSADLIYGSALQDDVQFENNLKTLGDLNVPHLSCYALTVEEKTVLAKRIDEKKEELPDADRQSAQFALLTKFATGAGYEHYEISNFAKPGFRSRHNSNYWRGIKYYGFGPSAHSYNGTDTRSWNIANNSLYLQSIKQGLIPFEQETLTTAQQQNEYLMISLRTAEGIDTDHLALKFSEAEKHRVQIAAEKFIAEGLLQKHGRSLLLTPKGKFLADGIAADLFK